MKVLPPVGQRRIELAGIGTQPQEVEARAEAGLGNQRGRAGRRATVEPRLHLPDLAHVRGQLAAPGDVTHARIEHGIDGRLQRREGSLPRGLQRFPAGLHLVPKKAGQQEARRHRAVLGHALVGISQCQLDEPGAARVRAVLGERRFQHREDAVQQVVAPQLLDAGQCVAGLKQLDHLVEQTGGRHGLQQGLGAGNGLQRAALDGEAQLGREAHHADDAHRVLAIARGGVADHPQRPGAGVGQAAVVVHHHLRDGVVVHRVDREVPTRGVLDLGPPDVVAEHAPAGVHDVGLAREFLPGGLLVAADLLGGAGVQVGPEGRDLDDLVLAATTEHHVHQAEAPADDEGPPEQGLDLLRRGVGGHVEVLGAHADDEVAHRTAHDVGLVACVLERAHHARRVGIDEAGIDAVLVGGDLGAPAQWDGRRGRRLGRRAGLAEQPADELLDHSEGGSNRRRMGQPRSCAMRASDGLGLVATGWVTLSSNGRSLVESL